MVKDKGYLVLGKEDYTLNLPVYLIKSIEELNYAPEKLITKLMYYFLKLKQERDNHED